MSKKSKPLKNDERCFVQEFLKHQTDVPEFEQTNIVSISCLCSNCKITKK